MTVAAVILAGTPASALADADGTPAARRVANTAWAGGATPLVVCSSDPAGDVAASLANVEVTLVAPMDPASGPVGEILDGLQAATSLVLETDAALVWPAGMAWVDAETVTSLIAAHGVDRATVLRPAYAGRPGWPVLLPIAHLALVATLAPDLMPEDLFVQLQASGVPFRLVETGDPGVVHDVTTPRSTLPPYEGPPEPADGHVHEWGAGIADEPDDAPVAGPARFGVADLTDA